MASDMTTAEMVEYMNRGGAEAGNDDAPTRRGSRGG